MEDFGAYYKTISNVELLEILEHAPDYEPDAIQAATLEFVSRNLSAEELATAQEEIAAKQSGNEKQKEKINIVLSKVKDAGDHL
jgi:hypothetical protein